MQYSSAMISTTGTKQNEQKTEKDNHIENDYYFGMINHVYDVTKIHRYCTNQKCNFCTCLL